jgi:2-hydroxycyclohexanecarboxyl-CoA dehydrogenase
MANKIALVTGAAGGIGSSICQRLIDDGYFVAATDINEKGLAAFGEQFGDNFKGFAGDQTNADTMAKLVAEIEAKLGPIEAFVNVTGWTNATRFETETQAYWDKVIALNFTSLLYASQPVLRAMIERKGGKMVFIASDAGRVGTGHEAVYAACKGAVIAFAKSLARENARHQINVNCVAPGPTATKLFTEEMRDHPEMVERMLKAIPFRRAAEPSEQASVVSYLLSDEASYITGQVLSVSGGLTMI